MAKSQGKPLEMPADPFGPFKKHVDGLRAALDAAASPFRPLNNALDALAEKLKASSETAFKPLKPLTDALGNLGKAWKDAIKPVADFKAALDAALEPLRAVRGAFDTLTAPVRAFLALPGKIAGAVGDMGQKAAGMLAGPSSQLQNFFGRVQGMVGSLVEKVNPSAVLRFTYALDDLYATVGSMLTPALNQFTALARTLGSALNGMTTEGKQLIAGLAAGAVGMGLFAAGAYAVQAALTGGIGPLLGAVAGALGGVAFATGGFADAMKPLSEILGGIGNRLGEVFAKFAGSDAFSNLAVALGDVVGSMVDVYAAVLDGVMPAFSTLASVFQALAPAIAPLVLVIQGPMIAAVTLFAKVVEKVGPGLMVLAEYLTQFASVVYDVGRTLFSFFGVNLPEMGRGAPRAESKDNTGMAAKQTSTTDVMSVLRAAREQAFRMGTGGQENYAQTTASATNNIAAEAKLIREKIDTFLAKMTPEAIGKAVADAIRGGVTQTARSAGDAVTAPGGGGALLRAGLTAWNPAAGVAATAAATARAIFG